MAEKFVPVNVMVHEDGAQVFGEALVKVGAAARTVRTVVAETDPQVAFRLYVPLLLVFGAFPVLTVPQLPEDPPETYEASTAAPETVVSVSALLVPAKVMDQFTEEGEQLDDAVTIELSSTIVLLKVEFMVAGKLIVCVTGMAIVTVAVVTELSETVVLPTGAAT